MATDARRISKTEYRKDLRQLQIELVRFQRHLIAHGHRILIILEGRDAAGKDGAIKRFVAHLSPRDTRVVALGKPSDRERSGWYFQRFVPYLPVAQELVLFNRSWYNRAGVERVMGFCTELELADFFVAVPTFETLLAKSGIQIFKYYLDISRAEQKRRLRKRRHHPLTQWKSSPIDAKAVRFWARYSEARDEMLSRTGHPAAPWIVVRADDKRAARLNIIRDFLNRVECPGKSEHLARPDPRVVFTFPGSGQESLQLAP